MMIWQRSGIMVFNSNFTSSVYAYAGAILTFGLLALAL